MDGKYWQIGEIAEQLGVTTKTLRHYEKIGLIEPQRSDSGYRLYSAEDVERLQRIRQLQALGLSLRQIKAIFTEDDGSLWQEAMQTLLGEVEAQIELLEQRRELISKLLERGEDIPEALEEPEFMPPALKLAQEYLEQLVADASPDGVGEGPSMSLAGDLNRRIDALLAVTGYLSSIGVAWPTPDAVNTFPQFDDMGYRHVTFMGQWK
jgi:DNA-binding transcriptional MerR regulator